MVNIITLSNRKEDILIIAHRGASNIAPPNTLKSFRKAIELKADYIEFDVHQSKDGEIIVIHDAYVTDELGQKRFIKEMNLEEIKTIDVGEQERIPTLKELIKLTKGKIGLQCEVKAPNFSKELMILLTQDNLIKNSIVSSFMFNELIELQKISSILKLALLIPPKFGSHRRLLKYCQKAINANFYAVHPHYKSINKAFVKLIHDHKMLVNVWTVNEESDIRKILEMGVDGIISDDIQLVKKPINES